jgi:Ca2+-binding EF-hand superfamily protein
MEIILPNPCDITEMSPTRREELTKAKTRLQQYIADVKAHKLKVGSRSANIVWREIFNLYDTDQNNKLNQDDVMVYLNHLIESLGLKEKVLSQLQQLPPHRDGVLIYYLVLLRQMFNLLDSKSEGYVEFDDLVPPTQLVSC